MIEMGPLNYVNGELVWILGTGSILNAEKFFDAETIESDDIGQHVCYYFNITTTLKEQELEIEAVTFDDIEDVMEMMTPAEIKDHKKEIDEVCSFLSEMYEASMSAMMSIVEVFKGFDAAGIMTEKHIDITRLRDKTSDAMLANILKFADFSEPKKEEILTKVQQFVIENASVYNTSNIDNMLELKRDIEKIVSSMTETKVTVDMKVTKDYIDFVTKKEEK